MNYNMLSNFAKDSLTDPKDYNDFMNVIDQLFIIGPWMAISVNVLIGVIFFVLSILIDTSRQNAFRT